MQMKELWRDWAVLENSMTFSVREVLGPKKFVGIEQVEQEEEKGQVGSDYERFSIQVKRGVIILQTSICQVLPTSSFKNEILKPFHRNI